MNNTIGNIISSFKKPRTTILASIFIILLLLVVINLVVVNINTAEDQVFIAESSDLRVLSQELAKNSSESVSGSEKAFINLSQSIAEFEESWTLINFGKKGYVDATIGFNTPLPPRREEIKAKQPNMDLLWDRVRNNTNIILSNKERIVVLNEIATTISNSIPQIQRNYDEVVDLLLDDNQGVSTLAIAQRQTWLSERIALDVNRIVLGDKDAQPSIDQFKRDISLFYNNHESLLEGDPSLGVDRINNSDARNLLEKITVLFTVIKSKSDSLIEIAPEISKAKNAANTILNDSEILLNEMTSLTNYFIQTRSSHLASPENGYVLLLLMLVVIWFYGVDMVKLSRYRAKVADEVNLNNNNAVMNLLEEISDLADGDLTTQATVSEEFTGAIADSINYTIGQLRELISTINDVTLQVSESTKSSESTAQFLSAASNRQTNKISAVSNSISEMEKSINWVSDNAQKSLQVAKNSVGIATGGAEVVKDTISGMDTIRDQIQETSKRIKRLGESSQEIGGFVSLINDISDNTNTLSLNAAIQAAMAGDAGRGFGVVADEVHALAERSSDASRQIEALVKVIQRDINEAVLSMEQTTSEVVKGTKLAQGAGEALDDIETVSKALEDLIENISSATTNQSNTVSQISEAMGTIQDITTETSSGTKATSACVVELVKQTESLRNAVAGFRLPDKNAAEYPLSYSNQYTDLNVDQEYSLEQDEERYNEVPLVTNKSDDIAFA